MNTVTENIQESILEKIKSGEFGVGDAVPKEVELAKLFKTSVSSANRAVKELEKSGLVKRIKKKGTFISDTLAPELLNKFNNGKSKNIHIIVNSRDDTNVHWSDETLRALETTVKNEGFSVIYISLDENNCDNKQFREVMRQIITEGSAGIVFSFSKRLINLLNDNIELLQEYGTSFFLHNRRGEYLPDLNCGSVSMDPYSDGTKIGRLVKKAGYKKAFLIFKEKFFPENDNLNHWASLRTEGVRRALTSNTNNGDSSLDIITSKNGFQAVCSEIKRSSQKICVISINSQVGAEFIDHARKQGLKTPDDYELITFDDSKKYYHYNMTALAAPHAKIGKMLGQMICDKAGCLSEMEATAWVKIPYEISERLTFKIR